jgi:hexokinase
MTSQMVDGRLHPKLEQFTLAKKKVGVKWTMTNLENPANNRPVGLDVAAPVVASIARDFCHAMEEGLVNKSGPLKMLPSFLTRPSGKEKGLFISLDFGGTNVRVQVVKLEGNGQWNIPKMQSLPLRDPGGQYDLTLYTTSAEELFAFLADQIAIMVDKKTSYSLGHTFSFPCRQIDLDRAELLQWTKEIRTAGVEGKEIGMLLKESLIRKGLQNIRPVAIINDTVGTLLTAAYLDPFADIGAICGTGHNTCYWEPSLNQIVNMESGNFDRLPVTIYDLELDKESEKPGKQRLEKMVAGHYLGELARLIAVKRFGTFMPPYSLDTKVLAQLIAREDFSLGGLQGEETALVREIGLELVTRSARLVASTFLGVLARIDPEMKSRHTIAVDGSLYEKMPGYAAVIKETLAEALGPQAPLVTIKLSKDGSGIGAAIAAALAEERFR